MPSQTALPFLERTHEIDHLTSAWRAAQAGRGSTWLLCAEAGGGKSRLARELAARTGARLLWGAAEPVSPPDPYLAVAAAIPGFEPAATRAESIARAVRLLEEMADGAQGHTPLLLVLDDLHFADEGTVAALVRLSAVCTDRPWLILGAFRPGEGAAALHMAATELVAQVHARRLDLPPLSRDAVSTLATDVRGGAVDGSEVDAIYADSGGNPWFVQALAGEQGSVSTARNRMLLRLDRVEASIAGANAVLAAIAPASRPMPQIVIATLCAGRVPGLRRVLTGLRDSGLLAEGESGWGFRHELMWRSLIDAMLLADQQDAHRALAEALADQWPVDGSPPAPSHPTPDTRLPTPAEIAMHFAHAGDARAAAWALRAAAAARAVDAHAEAQAQTERALRFELEPEVRQKALTSAALDAYHLGRFAEAQGLHEAALVVPGGEPEVCSRLHQRAANVAGLQGNRTAAEAHMDAAEQVLVGRPPSFQMAYLATGRLLGAVVRVEPERAEAAAARARRVAARLGEPDTAARIETEVKAHLLLSQLDRGNPAAFASLDQIVEVSKDTLRWQSDLVLTRMRAYPGAVLSLFHHEAIGLRQQVTDGIRRYELGWDAPSRGYRALELVQRAQYAEADALAATYPATDDPAEAAVRWCATVLREARAGTLERARMLLASPPPGDAFKVHALIDLARLDVAMLEPGPETGLLAERLYQIAEERQYARMAGIAAVALVQSGGDAPAMPAWLAAASPLRVLWDWAAGVARRDAALLRNVAARLATIDCPYESALALRDAGDLGAAYRALSALGAGAARQQVAGRLRTAGQPVPRRTRAAIEQDGLTETERAVVRLVADGARSEDAAATLGVSARTVESHLARIYRKTGHRGRVALANWWRARAT